ncbi:hypothetical protein SLU01_20050 [Sporosarcina luteola]|uniref:Uncharacterized protein n=1 Tax=Sporosarcina luteola TaxID=582850 RepID=A0A511Z8D8_9BACL|nr:hypothetical protein SLU01_20050 [Sporosarcina luteola]
MQLTNLYISLQTMYLLFYISALCYENNQGTISPIIMYLYPKLLHLFGYIIHIWRVHRAKYRAAEYRRAAARKEKEEV